MNAPLVASGARLVDAATGTVLAGRALQARVDRVAADLDALPPGLVLLPAPAGLDAVLGWLGCVRAGRAVLPFDPALPAPGLTDLVDRYAPAAVVHAGALPRPRTAVPYRTGEAESLGTQWIRHGSPPPEPHPDLGLVLATSGSTGRPRLVRSSRSGLLRHVSAIAHALAVEPDHVTATSLPLFYTYGLSVLNSHLAAGATVVVVEGGMLGQPFWAAVRAHGVGTLAGVPYHFRMLDRLRWRAADHPTVRRLTVAGGRMPDELALRFHEPLVPHGGGLYVMYGQTEAGSRITVLPPQRLADKLGSVGVPVPGTRIGIVGSDGTETTRPGVAGEVVCHGPGVMLGYAEHAGDLARGDDLGGTLRTGDLGRLDADGYLWLSGRSNRLAKVYGIRVDLDAVERALAPVCVPAAVALEDTVRVWCEQVDPGRRVELTGLLTGEYDTRGIELSIVDRLPRLANGKVDYRAIAEAG